MNQCKQCGGVTEYKKGVSKKTGKPYRGYKCTSCGKFEFINDPNPQKVEGIVDNKDNLKLLEMACILASKVGEDTKALYEQIGAYYKFLKILYYDGQPTLETLADQEEMF